MDGSITKEKEIDGLMIKEKEIVVPGQILASGMDYLPGMWTYRQNENIHASRLGLINIEGRAIRLIPLSGRYLPKINDTIIGPVIDVTMSGWRIDTNSAYSAILPMKDASADFIPRGADLTKYIDLGAYVVVKVTNVTSQKLVDVTMRGPGLHTLEGGRIIKVSPNKVPRIIGKNGSMVSMIKDATNCRIIVGQNGITWVQGEPINEVKAETIIRKIEAEAHINGLTDKIKEMIEKGAVQ